MSNFNASFIVAALSCLTASAHVLAQAPTTSCTLAQCAQKAVEAAERAANAAKLSVPIGAVIAFDLPSCPVGWQQYAPAAGRFVLGQGVGNTDSHGDQLTKRNRGDQGGEERHQLTIAEMPSHSHDITQQRRWGDRPGATGWGGDDGVLPGEAKVTTSAVGGDKPHNIMPPYITLLYCEKMSD